MGLKKLAATGQQGLGLLLAALIAADFLMIGGSNPPLAAFQLVHLLLSSVVGFKRVSPKKSAVLAIYLWAVAVVAASDPHGVELLDLLWGVFKVAAVPLALIILCGRKCCLAVLVVVLAVAVQLAVLLRPTFIAEDVLPHSGSEPTIVETPEFREQQCNAAAVHGDMKYMCEGIEPMSWEEAEAKAEQTLAQMSMAERHSLMQGIGWTGMPSFLPLPLPAAPKRGYYMGNTPPIPRLGLPALKLHDAGNGFRNMPAPIGREYTTIMWPSSLAFGATWNPALVEKVAGAIGKEYRGKGANVILGPSVQVQRVGRNGRNFEYMSGEDPYLGARLSEAYVRGVQREGVIACLKHYGFNEQETHRNGGNFVVDDRTAWELYYAPFEAGVAAGAGSIMCSYNRVNGTYACANEELLGRDLKKTMGFKGFVMSDWWALHDEPPQSVVRGFDQEMPGAGADTRFWASALQKMEEEKVRSLKGLMGLPHERMYTDAAFRIVATAWKMRLHERPSCTPGKDCVAAIESDQRSKENSDLARKTATESVVLLKNDGILPIDPSKVKTIALIGSALNATSRTSAEAGMAGDYYSGGGSGHCYVEKETLRTPLMGLTERAQQAGIRVLSSPSNDVGKALEVANTADLVLLVLATTAEEGKDRDDLSLDDGADGLVYALSGIRPIVVLAQVPGVVIMPWRNVVQAIAMMFLGGEYTSAAWEAVTFGDVSPSGKLPVQLPIGMSGVIEPGSLPPPAENHYSEGLFSSYRMRNAQEVTAFPFGHGLSYTNFTYASPVQLPKSKCKAYACVKTTVTNSGGAGRSGAEVAQAYVEFPPEAEEPKIVLRGFHRTEVLSPGAGEEVIFSFTERDFSIYRHGGWQVQSGITVHIGASSFDLRHALALKDAAEAEAAPVPPKAAAAPAQPEAAAAQAPPKAAAEPKAPKKEKKKKAAAP